MSLFALGAPRVASCENSHQRFPVRPCLYRFRKALGNKSVRSQGPCRGVTEGESSGKHLARCRRFVDDGVPSGVVKRGRVREGEIWIPT